jgi:WD40 repeat protein
MVKWRTVRSSGPGAMRPWLRSLRPPAVPLGSAQRHVFRVAHGGLDDASWSPDGKKIAAQWSGMLVTQLDMPFLDGAGLCIWDATSDVQLLAWDSADSYKLPTWSPDGTRLATQKLSRVSIWDANTGRLLLQTGEYKDNIEARCFEALAWSPNGDRIAATAGGGVIAIWDAASGELALSFEAAARGLAWSPDGSWLATNGENDLCIWRPETGLLEKKVDAGGYTETPVWEPGGRRILSSFGSNLVIWDIAAASTEIVPVGVRSSIQGLSCRPERGLLAWGDGDEVLIWDIDSRHELCRHRGHEEWVTSTAWSPGGHHLLSNSSDGTVRVWDPTIRNRSYRRKGHASKVEQLASSPQGSMVVTVAEGNLLIWDTHSWTPRSAPHSPTGVSGLLWSPDGSCLACSHPSGEIELWRPFANETPRVLHPSEPDYGHVHALAWARDSRYLAAVHLRQAVRLWDAISLRQLAVIKPRTEEPLPDERVPFAIGWSSEGALAFTRIGFRHIYLWKADRDIEKLKLTLRRGISLTPFPQIAWPPDSSSLFAFTNGGSVYLFDIGAAREVELTVQSGRWGIDSIAWSGDGRWLASVSRDSSKVTDVRSGQDILSLNGRGDPLVLLRCAKQGGMVWLATDDDAILVAIPGGERLARLDRCPIEGPGGSWIVRESDGSFGVLKLEYE